MFQRTETPLQSDSQGSKITRIYSQWSRLPVKRSHEVTSGQLPVISDVENSVFKNFYCTKRFEISVGFRAVFDLRPHLVVDILNFDPFVMRVTDMEATIKLRQ